MNDAMQTMGLERVTPRPVPQEAPQKQPATAHHSSRSPAGSERAEAKRASPAGKILVAEGSVAMTANLSGMLYDAGYAVATVADGIEAVRSAYHQAPDLIVLDIIMPRMNGYQVCRLLKNDPTIAHVPIIMLTPSDSRSDEFWSLQTGADLFLNKKAVAAELLNSVEQLLQTPPPPHLALRAPEPEEILAKVSALLDRKLYATTVEHLELKAIVQNLSEGILTVDGKGVVTHVNPALCRMIGARQEELVGHPPTQVLGWPAGPDTEAMRKLAESGQPVGPQDSILHSRSGASLPVAVNVSLLNDYFGYVAGCVYLFQDITRCAEAEARSGQLRALNDLKSDLASMIVHDLRTPLTSLISGLHTVESMGGLNEEQKEYVNISIDGGSTLLDMVNDLLDIGKMEEGRLSLHRTDVAAAAVVRRALAQVAGLARYKNLQLVSNVPADLPHVDADEEKVLRTLVNLLGNAVKFTPAEGIITVAARLADRGKSILFTVSDNGPGIPKEAFGRIFEKFAQVENRKAGFQGCSSGLGLTFCKMIAEAHGGRIWVESEIDKGSTFLFTLPVAATNSPQAVPL
ncbi:MAG TPA: ATP-binding protein [Abditibacteriaceae bacterium]|nr:ATP-binding protein [Abditibacteriaceae bacterium]